jgi:hypothetical protein
MLIYGLDENSRQVALPIDATSGAIKTTSDTTSARTYDFSFTSDAFGTASVSASVTTGRLEWLKIVPNLGATQPTNNFDIKLRDADGLDHLGIGATSSLGDNLPNTGPWMFQFDPSRLVFSQTLTLVVTGAGSGKTATITLAMS